MDLSHMIIMNRASLREDLSLIFGITGEKTVYELEDPAFIAVSIVGAQYIGKEDINNLIQSIVHNDKGEAFEFDHIRTFDEGEVWLWFNARV